MNEDLRPASPLPLDLIGAVDRFPSGKVLILGDVMLDEYLTGDAERISPEAPVPVVRVASSHHLLGGAGNVARNIVALGGEAVLVAVKGNDASGAALGALLDSDGIASDMLEFTDRPTTVKTRVLARQQQVVRIDREASVPLAESEVDALLEKVERHLPDCACIVISDYGKGVVSSRLMQGVHRLIAEAARSGRTRSGLGAVWEGLPIIVDPKPQNIGLYTGVTLLTPNAKETSESIAMPVDTPQAIVAAGKAIIEKLGCEHLVSTLGSRGMAVFEGNRRVWHIPTVAQQVFDVTGAGDTVVAALALCAAVGVPLLHACLLANYAAGLVIAHVGAATVTPNQLAEAVAAGLKPEVSHWA